MSSHEQFRTRLAVERISQRLADAEAAGAYGGRTRGPGLDADAASGGLLLLLPIALVMATIRFVMDLILGRQLADRVSDAAWNGVGALLVRLPHALFTLLAALLALAMCTFLVQLLARVLSIGMGVQRGAYLRRTRLVSAYIIGVGLTIVVFWPQSRADGKSVAVAAASALLLRLFA